VLVDDENKQATVIVPDDQLSLAIGKEGQNARLAARLTGWRVDIRSETDFAKEEAELGYEEEEVSGRCAAILANGKRCPNAALPASRYCGLPAHQALADQPGDEVAPAEAEAPAAEAEAPAAEAEAPAAEPEAPAAEPEPISDEQEADLEARADELPPDAEDSDGAAPDAVEGAKDLGPETEEPPTPSGAADSIDPDEGGSTTSEPEEFESDPDGSLEAQDVDPLPEREEEPQRQEEQA
jgi:transcription termination/antitermination protein NusA